jgi:predicted ATP-grasp superfamily ATP-dependent carboligase
VQIEDYRKKLYNFKDFIGYTNNYSFYNDYYIKKMSDLEWKRNEIENKAHSTDANLLLVPQKSGILVTLFRKVKKLFGASKELEKVIN